MIVRRITPGAILTQIRLRTPVPVEAAVFLEFLGVLRRVIIRTCLTVGKIILTVLSTGRSHAGPGARRGPEGHGAARVAVPEPVPLENRIPALTWAFSDFQAARSYSLIRPLRTGFRRI